MSTKKSTTASALGIPTAPSAARERLAKTPAAPAPANVTSITSARRKRPTSEQFKAAKELAKSMSGYDETSPIWNKKELEVYQQIQSILNDATASELDRIEHAEALVQALIQRRTFYVLKGSQLHA
jgi:hypothetical protein